MWRTKWPPCRNREKHISTKKWDLHTYSLSYVVYYVLYLFIYYWHMILHKIYFISAVISMKFSHCLTNHSAFPLWTLTFVNSGPSLRTQWEGSGGTSYCTFPFCFNSILLIFFIWSSHHILFSLSEFSKCCQAVCCSIILCYWSASSIFLFTVWHLIFSPKFRNKYIKKWPPDWVSKNKRKKTIQNTKMESDPLGAVNPVIEIEVLIID